MVALWLPVLIAARSASCVDVGNWFEHKRHLQIQADAAALAAAASSRVSVRRRADHRQRRPNTRAAQPTTPQIGGTPPARPPAHQLARPTTTRPRRRTRRSSGGPVRRTMIDVKLTETDLPVVLRGPAQACSVHQRARARTRSIRSRRRGRAADRRSRRRTRSRHGVRFVNENTGAVLGSTDLDQEPARSNGLVDLGQRAAPLPVTVERRSNIGVVIALGGQPRRPAATPLVECYDAGSLERHPLRARVVGGAAPAPSRTRRSCATSRSSGHLHRPVLLVCRLQLHVRRQRERRLRPARPPRSARKLTATVGGTTDALTYDASQRLLEPAGDAIPSRRRRPAAGRAGLGGDERHQGRQHVQDRQRQQAARARSAPSSARSAPTTPLGADQARAGVGERLVLGELVRDVQRARRAARTTSSSGSASRATSQNARASTTRSSQLRVVGGSQNQSLDCDPELSQAQGRARDGLRADLRAEHRAPPARQRRAPVGHSAAVVLRRDPDGRRRSTRCRQG